MRHTLVAEAVVNSAEWAAVIRERRLSRREVQILQCVMMLNDDDATIAKSLTISKHTVHTHLLRLYRKWDVNSRCQLVVKALLAFIDHSERTCVGAAGRFPVQAGQDLRKGSRCDKHRDGRLISGFTSDFSPAK